MTKQMIIRLVGAALGLLAGILMLTIGFWKTLLLILLSAAGWYLSGNTKLGDKLSEGIKRIRALMGDS